VDVFSLPHLITALDASAAVFGIAAAYVWYKASAVPIPSLGQSKTISAELVGTFLESVRENCRLSRLAAALTATTAFLFAVSTTLVVVQHFNDAG
jgi:hypothetical protein